MWRVAVPDTDFEQCTTVYVVDQAISELGSILKLRQVYSGRNVVVEVSKTYLLLV